MIQPPQPDEYSEYYGRYINLVKDTDLFEKLASQLHEMEELFSKVDDAKSNFKYAPGKWSIKEVLGHVLDAERVFSYRALCISREDKQPLPSFDENEFIRQSNFGNIKLEQLVKEFSLLRSANILLFNGFTDEMWLRKGTASNNTVSVRALAYILVGHAEHHKNILVERYNC